MFLLIQFSGWAIECSLPSAFISTFFVAEFSSGIRITTGGPLHFREYQHLPSAIQHQGAFWKFWVCCGDYFCGSPAPRSTSPALYRDDETRARSHDCSTIL